MTVVPKRAHVRSSLPTIRESGAQSWDRGLRVNIAVSIIDKQRKPHRNTSGTGRARALLALFFFLHPLSEVATLCSITWGALDRQTRHSCQRCHTWRTSQAKSVLMFRPFSFPPCRWLWPSPTQCRAIYEKKRICQHWVKPSIFFWGAFLFFFGALLPVIWAVPYHFFIFNASLSLVYYCFHPFAYSTDEM